MYPGTRQHRTLSNALIVEARLNYLDKPCSRNRTLLHLTEAKYIMLSLEFGVLECLFHGSGSPKRYTSCLVLSQILEICLVVY